VIMSVLIPKELAKRQAELLEPFVFGPLMREITTVDQLRDLPIDTVLLCRLQEVFQLKPTVIGPQFFAAGYPETPWSLSAVIEWAPLLILWMPAPELSVDERATVDRFHIHEVRR
jgi:hypothetical protein